MFTTRPILAFFVFLLALTFVAPAQGSAPEMALGHAWVRGAVSACLTKADSALASSGFTKTKTVETTVKGRSPLLAASLSCVASEKRTLVTVAVAAPSGTEGAARKMSEQLIELMTSGAEEQPAAEPPKRTSTMEPNTTRSGGDIRHFDLSKASPEACRDECIKDLNCKSWTYTRPGIWGKHPHCWLKGSVRRPLKHKGMVSGVIQEP